MIVYGANVPAASTTQRSARPIGISYEIICALARRPPRNDHLLLLAQPPSDTP